MYSPQLSLLISYLFVYSLFDPTHHAYAKYLLEDTVLLLNFISNFLSEDWTKIFFTKLENNSSCLGFPI